MHATSIITILACLFCSLIPAKARVGESLAQCKLRYKELKPTLIAGEFEATSGDVSISLCIKDGVCGMVFYSLSTRENLSSDAMLALIQANFGKQEWDISEGVTSAIKELGTSKDKKYTWSVMRMEEGGPLGLLVAKTSMIKLAAEQSKQEELKQIEGL